MKRGIPQPRKWPCVDCKTPKTATRVGTRCPACKEQHAAKVATERRARGRRMADALDRHRASMRRRMQQKRLEAKRAKEAEEAARQLSPSILLYREEKAKRDARQAPQMVEARDRLALCEAAAKPKRGRPKKTAVSTPDTRAA